MLLQRDRAEQSAVHTTDLQFLRQMTRRKKKAAAEASRESGPVEHMGTVEICPFKGQIISKRLLVSSDSSKK